MRDLVFDRAGLPITWDEWQALRQTDYRFLCQETIGDAWVSTVWLGINHAVEGPPVLFETMVFGGELDMFCWRYSVESDAMVGHMIIVLYMRISIGRLRA